MDVVEISYRRCTWCVKMVINVCENFGIDA